MTWLKVFLIELAFNKVYIFVSSTVRRRGVTKTKTQKGRPKT